MKIFNRELKPFELVELCYLCGEALGRTVTMPDDNGGHVHQDCADEYARRKFV